MTQETRFRLSRRSALALGVAGALTFGATGAAQADMHGDLAAKAADEPGVIWYESSQEDQADKIVAAFNETYPDVSVTHVRVVGGNKLAARVVQEMQAQGHTADVITGGATHTWQLNDRGYLMDVDWAGLGIPEALTPTPFTVATAASVYAVLYNTDKVSDEEAPKTWDELLDDKWKGRIGSWVRAAAFAQMAKPWGREEAEARLRDLVALEPFLFKSTFPMAQQVGAGEVDVALGFYHTAQPPIQAGAPLKVVALDPTPMHTIYTSITTDAPSPNGAKLFLSWLTSPEGAKAYEEATNRGSHLLEGTKTQALLDGLAIAEWPPEETAEFSEIGEAFNEILATAGTAQ